MTQQTPLTGPQWRGVYGHVRDHFRLTAAQRDQLDASPLYYKVMAFAQTALHAAAHQDWQTSDPAWRIVADTLAEIWRAGELGRDLGMPERPIR